MFLLCRKPCTDLPEPTRRSALSSAKRGAQCAVDLNGLQGTIPASPRLPEIVDISSGVHGVRDSMLL